MDDKVQSIVEQKIRAIDLAERLFKEAIANKDDQLRKLIEKWLSSLNIIDGKIDRNTNKKLLLALSKSLKARINKSTLKSGVSKLLKNFDDVEKYTKDILENENNFDLKDYDLSLEKKEAINEITSTLLNNDVLNANVIQPLRKIAFRHITTGISFKDAQKEFEKELEGKPLSRYARIITSEAIMRYDGMINQKIADDFNLDAFRIVGSLIKTSQPVCIHMINESGPFSGMAINGKYPMRELPAILRVVNSYKGAVSGTNESNYFINRNHWGCRHTFIPTRFTAKDLEGLPDGLINNGIDPVSNTVDEAKGKIKELFKQNTVIGLKDVVIDNSLSMDDINTRVAQIKNLFEEYRISHTVKNTDDTTIKMKSSGGNYGVVNYYTTGRILEINFGHKYSQSRAEKSIVVENDLLNIVKFNNKSRVDPKKLSLSTLTHEFAHVMSLSDINKHDENHLKFWNEIKSLKRKYSIEANKLIRSKNYNELEKVFLGSYAGTNLDEFYAEAFTEYKLSSTPSKYAKLVGSVIDKYYKK